MKFMDYIEEKITFVLFQISFLIILSLLLKSLSINLSLIFLIDIIFFLLIFLYLGFEYLRLSKKNRQIEKMVNDLEEKYLIAEVLPESKNLENQAYQKAIKIACKAMNDKISRLEKEKEDYQEYIESFVHEIKTPISALSLVYDNEKNYELKQEIQKIANLVEQILFYARSDVTEHDYFIRPIMLSDLIHNVLLDYKDYLIHQKITLNIHDLEYIVFTDEKWLHFIISQIVQNAIKYCTRKKKEITICGLVNSNHIILSIEDSGCGIKESDLKRVFEKGFTGSNRNNKSATGMGLYLAKKLSERLGLKLRINSKEGQYTNVQITFPKTNLYQVGMSK
ncbi:MAG: HAMP domain-containing histidine kinase [Bacilli bacterium]|nr:HAMP domain-containing histidine kinase [Bacilli bacterium]